MLVTFLIVHDPADRGVAEDLRAALENDGASCLLRASDADPSVSGASLLSRTMTESGVVVLLVSDEAGAFWQHDDVATIRSLLAADSQANRIVLVLVNGTPRSVLPADLASATTYQAGAGGWAAVAADLAAEARSIDRPATVMVGGVMSSFDDLYDEMVMARTGQPPPDRAGHGQRFETSGKELVVTEHGQVTRITPDEYEQKLNPEQLEDVARIEKSMEINVATWKRVYPTRAVNASDHDLFIRVRDALEEDLERLTRLLWESGFDLDDHYREARATLPSVS